MEKVPVELSCPTVAADHVIVAEGVGYGATKAAALAAARSNADSKLSIGVKCRAPCRTVVTESAPNYDSSVLTYLDWGAGQEATVNRAKGVSAACERPEPGR